MQISDLIRDLERVKERHGDCEIVIGEDNYRFGGHTYAIRGYYLGKKEEQPEVEHTCDEACFCAIAAEQGWNDKTCPVCDCSGCNQEPETEPIVYMMTGDQNSYALPSELISTEG